MSTNAMLGFIGTLVFGYVLVWCGWHLALWAARTGRIDPKKGMRG